MRIGAALLLIAVGAILKFAVSVNSTHGLNLNTMGVILMVVGAIGSAALQSVDAGAVPIVGRIRLWCPRPSKYRRRRTSRSVTDLGRRHVRAS